MREPSRAREPAEQGLTNEYPQGEMNALNQPAEKDDSHQMDVITIG
jgi:hypothetical protein